MISNIKFYLEEVSWGNGVDYDLLASGWAFSPGKSDSVRLFARVNGRTDEASWFERPDVWRHFEGDPAALRSGFQVRIHSCRPSDQIEFWASTSHVADHMVGQFAAGAAFGTIPFICGYPEYVAGDMNTRADRAAFLSARLAAQDIQPTFSIITPVCDPEPAHLQSAIDSVLAQIYVHWEWRIHDDGSTDPVIISILSDLTRRDQRIHVRSGPRSGNISTATIRALTSAQGDYLAFLDHDDALHPHALAEFALVISEDPSADLIYSDEDKLNEQGQREEPALKPDFSPEYLLGVMYLGHLLCVRAELLRLVSFPFERFHGVQDYELALRLSEQAKGIRHLPKVLYHWRRHPRSVAARLDAKDRLEELQVEAVNEALQRRNRPGRARALGGLRIAIDVDDALLPILTTITASDSLLKGMRGQPPPIVLKSRIDSASLAKAIEAHPAGILYVLPELVEFVTPEDERLLAAAFLNPRVAAAGPILIDRNQRVIAAGLFIDGEQLLPCHKGIPWPGAGYRGSLAVSREVSALPSAGVCLRASAITSTGGLDTNLPLCFSLPQALKRASAAGWSVLAVGRCAVQVTPEVESQWIECLSTTFPKSLLTTGERSDPFYRIQQQPPIVPCKHDRQITTP